MFASKIKNKFHNNRFCGSLYQKGFNKTNEIVLP